MLDLVRTSNGELDALALDNDARAGERTLDAVFKFLGTFVAYPSEHAHVTHALWCVHAHLMDKWESTPRLAFLSAEPASGKTRALEITELMVPNPVQAVNVSPAYLFRKVGSEDGPPTILFDEIDTVFGPKAKENEEIRGLLNAGHRRGAVAGRCVVHGKQVLTEEIPAYAAVAVAGLGWLPDTLLSRSIVIRMQPRKAGERVEPFRRRLHGVQGHDVYTRIDAWAVSAEIAWPDLPPEIQDRDADVWEPLVAVADAAGGSWPERAREAAVALVAAKAEAEPSLGIRLLADLHHVFDGHEAMSSKSILAGLRELDESPWGDIRGKPLDQRGLAYRLRQYGVRSKNIAIGETRPKGYARADLHDAWMRYLPSIATKSATSATSATDAEIRAENVADVAVDVADALRLPPQKNPSGSGVIADVADVADLAGNGGDPPDDCLGIPEFLRRDHPRCEQCRGEPDGTERKINGHVLHAECARFWREGSNDEA